LHTDTQPETNSFHSHHQRDIHTFVNIKPSLLLLLPSSSSSPSPSPSSSSLSSPSPSPSSSSSLSSSSSSLSSSSSSSVALSQLHSADMAQALFIPIHFSVFFERCFSQIETTPSERKCSSEVITESDEKQIHPFGLESIERFIFITVGSGSLQLSNTVFYGSGTKPEGDSNSGIMDMDRLLQRTMILSTDADFTANRILQRVPMNLMNGSTQELASTSTTEDMPGSSSSASVFSSTTLTARNSSKTLKCPKCNWHYKYQETLEIHMKEKHAGHEVKCIFCLHNRPHPRLARGESYSCGYKPYRCEICKYSTTTKGNLSIHMQSDKHLHAVQEIPPVTGNAIAISSGDLNAENLLQCMICSTYSTDNISKMIEHIEKDRSHPVIGDISVIQGVYHCNLCPYSTSLKANFQLHTRTDKHVQRTQMVSELQF
uniref:C2H2-type domain-containing protein n=1 Tax=Brugia pahangi TaxID=6280 RepID=A0A0N4TVS9_BRUPA